MGPRAAERYRQQATCDRHGRGAPVRPFMQNRAFAPVLDVVRTQELAAALKAVFKAEAAVPTAGANPPQVETGA